MTRKTVVTLLAIILVLAVVWGLTAYQRARKTQDLLTQLAEQDEGAAMEAMAQLRHRGSQLGDLLVPYLTSENERVRWRAAVLCAEVGAKAMAITDRLILLLADPVPAVQRAAALACGTLQLKETEAPILQLLGDTDQSPLTRAVAAQALGTLRAEGAVDTLAALLKQHPLVEPKVEEEEEPAEVKPAGTATPAATPAAAAGTAPAATAAAPAATPAAAPAAEAPPPDDLWHGRMEAAWSLGQIGTPKCAAPLAETARDDVEPRVDVRVAAAYALGDLGASARAHESLATVVNALVEALGDEAGDVRLAAATSLARVYPPEGLRTKVETALREHMNDDHFWVRRAVEFAMRGLVVSPTG